MTEYFLNQPTGWKISHKWKTTVSTALTGAEKRSSVIQQPRVEMNAKYVTGQYSESEAIRGQLYQGTHELWRVPVWCDRAYLTVESGTGSYSNAALPDPPSYTDTTPEEIAFAYTFDGTADDVITIASTNDLQLETEDWTIQMWVKLADPRAGACYFITKGEEGSGKGVYQDFITLGFNGEYFYFRIDSGTSHVGTLFSTTEPSADTWYYVTVTYDSSDLLTPLKMYVNGTLEDDTLPGSAIDLDDDDPLLLGATAKDGVGTQYYMNGEISDARYSKGIVRWTSNFTPPTRGHSGTGGSVLGSNQISVADASNRRFFADRNIIVCSTDLATYEWATISGIEDNVLTLTEDLTNGYSAGSYVFPAYECRIASANKITRKVRNYDTWALSFTEAYESDRDYTPKVNTWTGTTYSGLDVFEFVPNSPLQFGIKHDYDLLEYHGKGIEYSWYDANESVLDISATYIMNSRATVYDVFEFFDDKMGRYDRFWLPSWNKDFTITAPYTSTDTTITVSTNSANTYYGGNDLINRHLMFRFPDGTKAYKQITTFSGTSITLSEQIGHTEATDYGKTYVSFLILSRFDIDQVEAEYQMENIATFDLYFKGLIDEDL